MPNTLTDSEKRQKLAELMGHFSTAMLVTRTAQGEMRSRPLSIVEKKDERVLYFSTAIESPKVGELEDDPHVNVVMQDKKRFVSISGHARISRDRALIERLWSDTWKVWFPKGKDDPSLALVIVQPLEATYWDTSGSQGIKYVFESAKAYLSGKRPPTDDDENVTGHVKL